MSKKRTLDAFFSPTSKKVKADVPVIPLDEDASINHSFVYKYSYNTNKVEQTGESKHQHYPHPIRNWPTAITKEMSSLPCSVGREINDQPDLDLLYFEPYIPSSIARPLFEFLRSELPFYRVEYKIKRGGIETDIRTPRYERSFAGSPREHVRLTRIQVDNCLWS